MTEVPFDSAAQLPDEVSAVLARQTRVTGSAACGSDYRVTVHFKCKADAVAFCQWLATTKSSDEE